MNQVTTSEPGPASDPYVEASDANPERRELVASDGERCMIYRQGGEVEKAD